MAETSKVVAESLKLVAETSKDVAETLPGGTENKNVTEIEVSSEKNEVLKKYAN